jgi:hypothetical protein
MISYSTLTLISLHCTAMTQVPSKSMSILQNNDNTNSMPLLPSQALWAAKYTYWHQRCLLMPSTAGLPSRIAGQLPLTICIYRSFCLHASPLLLSLSLSPPFPLPFVCIALPLFLSLQLSLCALSFSLSIYFVRLTHHHDHRILPIVAHTTHRFPRCSPHTD